VRLGNGVTEKDLLVHDERGSLGYLALLAEMKPPELPMPIGVFRRTTEPTFDTGVRAQIEQVTAQRGPGDLRAALRAGHTWDVE
jgi:hypothetical protein